MDTDMNIRIKKPTTFAEQVEHLKSKNLVIENDEEAVRILERINYYRLSGYMLTYKTDDVFNGRTSIRDIYALYNFDKKLRNLILPVLESIEIAFKTHIAYLIAHKYGSLGYENHENFQDREYHKQMLERIKEEIKRNKKEAFVSHHNQRYDGNFPIWVVIELMSFGQLSQMYRNLKDEDQDEIAKRYYGTKKVFIRTWLHSLSTFRNICAHYGRIYNRKLEINPKLFNKDKKRGLKNNTTFATLFIVAKLLENEDEGEYFITSLAALVEQYSNVIDLKFLGFPRNWEQILRR